MFLSLLRILFIAKLSPALPAHVSSALAELLPRLTNAIVQPLNQSGASQGAVDMPLQAWGGGLPCFAAHTGGRCHIQYSSAAQPGDIAAWRPY